MKSAKDSNYFEIMDLQVWASCESNAHHEALTSRNDSPLSSLRGQRTKQSIKDSIKSSDSVESSDSNIMDCHANPCGLSRNDGIGIDLQVWASCESNAHHEALTSRNDSPLSSLRGQRPKQSIKDSIKSSDSIESSDSNIMDCHANPCGLSRNDGIGIDLQVWASCYAMQTLDSTQSRSVKSVSHLL